MRFLMSAVFLFSALAVPAPVSAEELKLAGTWVLTVDARGGQRDYYLELKQDGSNLGPLALARTPLLNAESLVDFLASEFLEFDQDPAKPTALQLGGDTALGAATTAAA